MRQWVRVSAGTALLTAGFIALGAGVAVADTGDAVTSGDASVLGGNQVVTGADVPVNVAGNAIGVLGIAGAVAEETGAAVVDGSGPRRSDPDHQLAPREAGVGGLLQDAANVVGQLRPVEAAIGDPSASPARYQRWKDNTVHQSTTVVASEDTAPRRKGLSIGDLVGEQAEWLAALPGLGVLDDVRVLGG